MGLEIVGDQWQILLEIKLNKKNYAQCGLFEPFIECPEWGSNPHWEDFKSSASAIGLSGPCDKSQSLLAFLITESNIFSVNLPVNVFCWLG